jgi:hypothetical protein
MTKNVEYMDTDFLGNKIDIGDTVIFEAPKYRDFVVGKVVTKAPKSCQIEYINDWNYSSEEEYKEVVRQSYGQIIKYPVVHEKHGEWIEDIMEAPNPFDNGETTIDVNIVRCSVCGECFEKVAYHRNYCENCGAKNG